MKTYNMSTKVLHDAYSLLREELNGSCGESCPKVLIRFKVLGDLSINNRLKKAYLDPHSFFERTARIFCKACSHSFKTENSRMSPCPCDSGMYTTKQILLRLDEFIDELEVKLTKEYSS